jgi:hypothetical protein
VKAYTGRGGKGLRILRNGREGWTIIWLDLFGCDYRMFWLVPNTWACGTYKSLSLLMFIVDFLGFFMIVPCNRPRTFMIAFTFRRCIRSYSLRSKSQRLKATEDNPREFWNTDPRINIPSGYSLAYLVSQSRDSSVSITAGYELGGRVVGVRVPVGSRIFSSPRKPGRLWGLHSLLFNGHRGLFPRG